MERRTFFGIAATTLAAAGLTPLNISAARATPAAFIGARFDHMSINVRAFDAMIDWYRDRLGFEVEVAWRVEALDGKRLAYMVTGDTRIELVEADPDGIGLPPPETFPEHFGRTGYGHLCFAVDDVGAVLSGLEAEGVPTFVRAETYALDGTDYERRVGSIQDPEGNVLEFAEPLRHRA